MSLLLSDERTLLIETVGTFISGNPARIAPVISQHHFIRIQTDTRAAEYAFHIISYCERSAWLEDPALIIKLLTKWDDLEPFSHAIQRIKNGAPPKFHIANRPWDTALLAVDLPFLNRAITREAVEGFLYPLVQTIQPPGIRALVVRGKQDSGRRFTLRYLEYVNSFLLDLNFRTVSIDLEKQTVNQFTPDYLTSAILDQLNPDWRSSVTLPVFTAQQESRWTIQLTTLIMEQISIGGSKCIIVLSGFGDLQESSLFDNNHRIPPATQEMIMLLLDVATGKLLAEESSDLLRIVLLGFNPPVTNFKNRLRVDEIRPIIRRDINDYFKAYARFHNKPIDDDALDEMVEAVFENDDENDSLRTKRLADLALRMAREIFQS